MVRSDISFYNASRTTLSDSFINKPARHKFAHRALPTPQLNSEPREFDGRCGETLAANENGVVFAAPSMV